MYCKKNPEWLTHLDFEIVDVLCIIVSMIIVQFARGMSDKLMTPQYLSYVWIIILGEFLSLLFIRPYQGIIQRGHWQEFIALVKHYVVIYSIWVITVYMQHDATALPRLSLGTSFILSLTFAYPLRQINKTSVRSFLRRNRGSRRIMVITESARLQETLKQLSAKRYTDAEICAVNLKENVLTQDILDLMEQRNMEVTVGLEAAIQYLTGNIIDEVILDQYEGPDWEDVILRLLSMGQVVHISVADSVYKYPNLSVDKIGSRYVLTTNINSAYHWQLAAKRLVDICGALAGLAITAVAAIFIVPAIYIADPGPVIFKQKRVGKNGRVFNFYKFRSMYLDAEERKAELMAQNEMSGLMFKMENDPRIIGSEKGPGKGIGNFIRRTSLDELPQFWNILKGDMSLVGTRPPTLGEYEQYEPHHKIRLSMQPGLTGAWQVSGRSDITDFEEVVRLDSQYIENWSLAQDVRILAQTFGVVFAGKGSR